jgi:hypothetical protein
VTQSCFHQASTEHMEVTACWWLKPVILDTQEAEIKRIVV